jgi:aminopeptidase N
VFYEVPGGHIKDALDPASVAEFMTSLTELLGPFPYGNELRFAGAPTAWLGFEHPANIVLDERLGGPSSTSASRRPRPPPARRSPSPR